MDRAWHLAGLSLALTLVVSGAIALRTTDEKVLGWALVTVGALLVPATYLQGWIAPARSRPRADTIFKLTGYRTLPYPFRDHGKRYAAEVKFRVRRMLQPTRLRIVCDRSVYNAAAVMDWMKNGEWIEGWVFEPTTEGNSVLIEFAGPPADPRFEFLVEVRAPEPIQITQIRRVKKGPAPRAVGFLTKGRGGYLEKWSPDLSIFET